MFRNRFDWIEFHDISSKNHESNNPEKICGSCGYSSDSEGCEQRDAILTKGNEVIVKFTSDISVTGRGFWLDFIASK